jgi:hypothetical protein
MNALAAVVNLHDAGHWTEAKYREERERIRSTYGDSSFESGALRDQALAALFYRSGWTQEELAKAEGKGQQWVSRQMLFGKFLAFTPTGVNPKNLTERRFRGYWEQTDKTENNERIRFRQVQRFIDEATVVRAPRRNGLSKEILDGFADGKWHDIATIAKHTEQSIDTLVPMLSNMGGPNNSYGVALCERKQRGKSFQYRIMRAGRRIDLDVLMQDLGPIIDGLREEGKKNVATISPTTVAYLAHQLEQLLEKLAK